MAMPKIKVGKYRAAGGTVTAPPVGNEWAGWIEPEDKRWILFIAQDGSTAFFHKRDADGGVTDDALCLPAKAVAGTMLGRAQGIVGNVEWAWVNEHGGLDGDARTISREIMSKLQSVDLDDVIASALDAMKKDGDRTGIGAT